MLHIFGAFSFTGEVTLVWLKKVSYASNFMIFSLGTCFWACLWSSYRLDGTRHRIRCNLQVGFSISVIVWISWKHFLAEWVLIVDYFAVVDATQYILFLEKCHEKCRTPCNYLDVLLPMHSCMLVASFLKKCMCIWWIISK